MMFIMIPRGSYMIQAQGLVSQSMKHVRLAGRSDLALTTYFLHLLKTFFTTPFIVAIFTSVALRVKYVVMKLS